MRQLIILTMAMSFLLSCSSIPRGATVIENFIPEKYTGRWYEIARFDYRFERNMDHTTAEYSINPNGSIKVVNKGYDYIKNKWKTATGIAKFVGHTNEGKLKVSFFRPFYGAYNIIALDDDYSYALIAGKNTKYIWILSRTKTIPDNIKTKYLDLAQKLGYDTGKLIWVNHD